MSLLIVLHPPKPWNGRSWWTRLVKKSSINVNPSIPFVHIVSFLADISCCVFLWSFQVSQNGPVSVFLLIPSPSITCSSWDDAGWAGRCIMYVSAHTSDCLIKCTSAFVRLPTEPSPSPSPSDTSVSCYYHHIHY